MEPTTFDNYQALALRTEKPLPTAVDRLNHAKLGLITEIGEIATQVKRIRIYEKTLGSLDKDGVTLRAHLAEEMGDVLWYMAIASDALGLNIFRDVFPHLTHDLAAEADDALHMEGALTALCIVGARIAHAAQMMMQGSEPETDITEDLSMAAQYLTDLAHIIDVDLERIAAENIAKLRARYPDAYSNEAAEARADKGGLDARVS